MKTKMNLSQIVSRLGRICNYRKLVPLALCLAGAAVGVARAQSTLITSNALWSVTDITDPNNQVYIGQLQAPFSSYNYAQSESISPAANTWWHATNVPPAL